jgi:hypothetical protein
MNSWRIWEYWGMLNGWRFKEIDGRTDLGMLENIKQLAVVMR